MSRRKHLPTAVVIAAALLFRLTGSSAGAAELYALDPVHSSVTFKVKHMGVANVHGRFNELSGALRYDAQDPDNFSVTVQVVAGSVDTSNSQRDQHLRSPDFFDVQQFPLIEFKSTIVKKMRADTYAVHGDLSLHGVTRPLKVEVVLTGEGKDYQGNRRIGFETDFQIKRSDFGMNKMLTSAGDVVRLTVSIEGVRE